MHPAIRFAQRQYWRFLKWQHQTREPGLTALLFIEGALLFGVTPLVGIGWLPGIAMPATFALFVVATLVVTSQSHLAAGIVLLALILSSIGSFVHEAYPSAFTACLSAGGWALSIGVLSIVIAIAVYGPGRVTWHRIQGAVVLYMNFALMFFILYRLINLVIPDAFTGLPPPGSEHGSGAALLYFSFSALTTANFGDIIPVFPLARSFSNMESVIGQLFPATLMARLVTLHFAHQQSNID